jgi:hypothetical protein
MKDNTFCVPIRGNNYSTVIPYLRYKIGKPDSRQGTFGTERHDDFIIEPGAVIQLSSGIHAGHAEIEGI